MPGIWDSLSGRERDVLRASGETMSDVELADRFVEGADGSVRYRTMVQSSTAEVGHLDIDEGPAPGSVGQDDAYDDDDGDGDGGESFEEPIEGPGWETPRRGMSGRSGSGSGSGPAFDGPAGETDEYEFDEVVLISPEDFDYDPDVDEDDERAAIPIDESMADLESYFDHNPILDVEDASLDAEMAGLPPVTDMRAGQSPVKNQARRGTCVSHAALALLEAHQHIPEDLSEQYAHYNFNEFLNRRHDENAGLRTTDAAKFLADSDGRVCLESEWPYIPTQSGVNSLVQQGQYGPPAAARDNQRFGYKAGGYKIIPDRGLAGRSIRNTRYLEALLYQGYTPVIGTWVAWDDKDNNGVLDPRFDSNGEPIRRGGHAMLLVGYNRSEEYFIVKNSWSSRWGHSGYGYLHYNYVRTYFKYGFVVSEVVPESPAAPLPRTLARAPFSDRRISRGQLRAAVLFMRSSQGRFAVAEAYAGDNLSLRNLRVYNTDGSIHLERDSLVVRSSYLFDIDSGRETRSDADFWWHGIRRGVHYLESRNGAAACIGFDLARFDVRDIARTRLSSSAVPSADLDYAVVVGHTTGNQWFKLLAHAGDHNQLRISYLEVLDRQGRRRQYKRNVSVPSSWTYNVDTGSRGGGRYADIWWHVVSDDVGFLERYSTARTQLVWCLGDRSDRARHDAAVASDVDQPVTAQTTAPETGGEQPTASVAEPDGGVQVTRGSDSRSQSTRVDAE